MPYVVTQACCADASCVVACPVNCIHPAPGEPGFAEAEMVFVDAASCVDCGACATACPVDAIKPHTTLTVAEEPFLALNAAYYDVFPHRDRAPLAPAPPQRRPRRAGPIRVAVVGAGPAGLYTADELLRHPGANVDVYDRLPVPHGLVRFGVAPDHPLTRRVQRLFGAHRAPTRVPLPAGRRGRPRRQPRRAPREYDAVVYAVGAASDRRLGIAGEDLPGSLAATDLVAWYNGHPERRDLDVDLGHERAVVVGTGNVALDIARMLTHDAAVLAATDVDPGALAVLSGSRLREVVLLGRRGTEHAAFTLPELLGLAGLVDDGRLDVVVDAGDVPVAGDGARADVLRDLAARVPRPGLRRVVLRFGTRPVRLLGTDRVTGVEVERGGRTETLPAGLVVRAIGYHGKPVPDLPHDAVTGTVPHRAGRVRPGVYVVGWAKRGPRGFIGTNKWCAQETVASLLDDLDEPGASGPRRYASRTTGRGPARADEVTWPRPRSATAVRRAGRVTTASAGGTSSRPRSSSSSRRRRAPSSTCSRSPSRPG